MPSGQAHSIDELAAVATRLTSLVFPGRALRHIPTADLGEDEVARFAADSYLVSLQASSEGWIAWLADGSARTRICRVFDFDTLQGSDAPFLLAKDLMGDDCPPEMAFVADVWFEDEFSGQRSYQQKRFQSSHGEVLLHLRRVPEGVEHVFEVPKHADTRAYRLRVPCHSILWHNGRGEYLWASERHGELPDWTIALSGRRFAGGPDPQVTRTVTILMSDASRPLPSGRGFYQYSALSVRTHFDFGQAVAANRDWCTSSKDGTWKFNNLATAELNDIAPLLISQHERQHYRQMITSPWGLLIFRIQVLLDVHVDSILKNLSTRRVDVRDLFPLGDWYRNNRDTLRGSDRELYWHLDPGFSHLEALSQFMTCIVGAERLSPRDFVQRANACLEIVERCFGVAATGRWKEPGDDVAASSYFPVLDIVEASARMTEYGLLERGENDRLLQEWRVAHFKGGDENAFSYVVDQLRNPLLAHFALDAALQALVDPSWGCMLGRQLEFAKDHPGARLQLIVDYLLKHWDGTQNLVELNKQMCSDLELELVDRTAAVEIVKNVRAAKKMRRSCSKEFELLLVDKFCAGITRRGALADAEVFDLVRGMPPVYEIWNDRSIPGDQSIPATHFYDELQIVLLQAQIREAALADGVLDEDFVFRDQLRRGECFGTAIDSQFIFQ